VYVPPAVVFTQFGESFNRQVPTLAVVAFETCADQLPVCPPLVRVSVTPVLDPEVFQPVRSDSKPWLPTNCCEPGEVTATAAVAVDELPPVSVTVTVTVYVPGWA
jgi:hypothetical protein